MVVSHPIIGKDSSLSEFLERQDPPPRYFMGVPKGSILETTLFNLFLKDFETVTKIIISNNSEGTEQTTFSKITIG